MTQSARSQGVTSHQKLAIMANGELAYPSSLKDRIASYPFLAAVDGGLDHCKRLALKPDVFIGDGDSVSEETLKSYKNLPLMLYPKDKDKSDLQIAIELVVHPAAKEVTVFAGLGKRIDHSLANLYLLSFYPGILRFETELEFLWVINKHLDLKCHPGQTLSLLPLMGPVEGVTSTGLKWELCNDRLDQQRLSLSNVCLKEACSIRVAKGNLLLCLQKF